jgi:NAD(P)-dependent dehydrogenase (short-subunit alcohol dehydrogenase family)
MPPSTASGSSSAADSALPAISRAPNERRDFRTDLTFFRPTFTPYADTPMPSNSEALAGQRVVLLGGTAGIGLATAKAAVQEGATIVLVSSQQQRVDQAVAELPAGTTGHAADLTNEAAVSALFERIGPFDHLVFTAGGPLHLEPLAATTMSAARAAFDLRFWGAYMAAKYASPHIRAGGSITMTTGSAGARPRKGWTVAASICTALEGLTRSLAIELGPIRVNAVSAGIVRTDLWDSVPSDARESFFRDTGAVLPVQRIGDPADIAQAFVYLMREGYSTGTIVLVDGGYVLV